MVSSFHSRLRRAPRAAPALTRRSTPGTASRPTCHRVTAPKKPPTPASVIQEGDVRLEQPAARADSETTSGLGARNIGSAAMSGRIAALAATHVDGRLTIYVGAASGGVWKSTNGGTTDKPVFDKQPGQSIGAVTIDPTNSKVIWVGTGESWMRNSVSLGDRVYTSIDGGENWTNMGLKTSEHLVKILVHPTPPNPLYLALPGKLFSDSDDRGVYKTIDGGKTWTKILAGANASTGCSMMSMDPQSPQILYAA